MRDLRKLSVELKRLVRAYSDYSVTPVNLSFDQTASMKPYILNLSSSDRQTGTSVVAPRFDLSRFSHVNQIKHVGLHYVRIPWFVSNLTSAKNNVTFELKEVATSATWSVTLTDNHYTPTSLAQQLTSTLTTMTPPGSAVFTQSEFAVTYDVNTRKFTIAADTTSARDYQLVSSTSSGLLTMMGFGSQMDTTLTESNVATRPARLAPTNAVYVVLEGMTQAYSSSTSAHMNTTLATIPLSVEHGELLSWEDNNPRRYAYPRGHAGTLQLRLLDDQGEELVNHDMDWQLGLMVTIG